MPRLPTRGIRALRTALLLLSAAAVAAAGQPHPGRSVAVEGGRLFVETEGSGPPLILLPAGPGLDHAYFHPYLSSLAPYARLVYYDPRGCGRSDLLSDKGNGLDEMVADLEALRRQMGFETIDLLGHGLGQAVATLYASRYPGRVRRLIFLGAARHAAPFLDGPGLLRRVTPEMKAALDSAGEDRYLSDDGRLRERFRVLAPLLFHRLGDRAFQRAFVDRVTVSAAGRERLARDLEAAPDLSVPLRGLKSPVLIVAGRYDPTSDVAEAEAVRDAVPGSRLVVLEESGAFPFAEEPVEFLKVVKEFLVGEGAP